MLVQASSLKAKVQSSHVEPCFSKRTGFLGDTASGAQNGLDAHFRHDSRRLWVRRHHVVETRPKAMGHKSIPITTPGLRIAQITWWIQPGEVVVGIVSMEQSF